MHKLARFFLLRPVELDVYIYTDRYAENSKSMVDRGRAEGKDPTARIVSGWAKGPRYSDGKKLISGWRNLALAAR